MTGFIVTVAALCLMVVVALRFLSVYMDGDL